MIRISLFLSFSLLLAEQTFAQVYGTPVQTWDFANGIPENWEVGVTSLFNVAHWEYRGPDTTPNNLVGARGSCSAIAAPISSPSQNNGFVIFDGNYWDDPGNACGAGLGSGPDPAPHTAWLITESFDLTGINTCVLTFQQQYRHFQASTTVHISTDDGASWIQIASNEGIQSPNSEWKSVNISEWAANQPNVRLKFQYQGTYYWWLLDDITVYSPNENDLLITRVQYTDNATVDGIPSLANQEYNQYPLAILPSLKFKSQILNIGGNSQSGVRLNARVIHNNTTTTYNQTGQPTVVEVGAAASLAITGNHTPNAGVGDYKVLFSVLQDATDDSPGNNLDSLDFQVTPFTYAKDEGPMVDSNSPDNFYDQYQVSYGNFFENKGPTHYCHTIQAAVATGTQIGKEVRGVVYNQSVVTLLAFTPPYIVNFGDLNEPGEERLIYLDFDTPFAMLTDSIYYMAVEEVDSIQPFLMARNGRSIGESSLIRYNNINASFTSNKSFLIRLTILPQNQNPGCTDQLAVNYESDATLEDGSCDYAGCTNEDADNFNSEATFDDGTCLVAGCTDSEADNYNPLATYQAVPCIYRGCTSFTALNFNPQANEDDSTCVFLYTDVTTQVLGGCPPFNLHINNNNEFTPEATCLYTLNGEVVSGECSGSFDLEIAEPGVYELSYTITIGNSIADTTLTVNVFSPSAQPQLSFDINSNEVQCTNCGSDDIAWYLNGELIETSQNSILNAELDGITQNGYYYVVTTNSFGCSVASDSVSVAQPHLAISSSNGCAPVTIYFNNLTDTISGLVCSLNTGISVIDNFTGQIAVEYEAAGNYEPVLSCSMVDASGTTGTSIAIYETEIPLLAVDSASQQIVCTNSNLFTDFLWNVDGNILVGGSSQPLGNDVYQLQAYNENGCGGNNLLIVNGVTQTGDSDRHVYPNPASTSVTITNPDLKPFRIINATGHVVFESRAISASQSIDTTLWPTGVYLIQWLQSTNREAVRFEISR
ncbi:MAG: T9SS type A sorting domain-containing protein [Flavobacteriales bacterium]